ncbi:MAG: hypothetical protein CML60_02840 [Rhodobacteraceae bacterium]|nr:hypothetical protein [Paracoccaceae bacterium]MBT25329.1 hypothetical protein [Paracoccaceae bacterium]
MSPAPSLPDASIAQSIVRATLGQSVALLSPVSGTILLTNAFGLRILDGLCQARTPQQIARHIAETPDDITPAYDAVCSVLDSWTESGLLMDGPPAFPDPVPYRALAGTELLFAGAGGRVRFRCPDAILTEQIDVILGHMTTAQPAPATCLEVIPDEAGFAIFRDQTPLTGRISLDAARFVIVREIAEIICGPSDVAAVFHAGCVAQNERSLLICGDSGQGKSTLTLGLVAAGCDYLGDDHIPLHHNGNDTLSFPTSAGVKPGSWGLNEVIQLQHRFDLTPRQPRMGVRYLPLHLANAPKVGQPVSVAAIIFPNFNPSVDCEIQQIPPEQALIEALKAGSRLSGSHRADLSVLASFLNRVPAYRLTYDSSGYSVPTCLELLNAPRP